MTMSIANTFPVFEADQVLTNQHLNDLFNYLDQQDRLTRCKLLGSGIVCGLEISRTPDTINITKGCGLSSQGYLILFCDHIGREGYKYYMPYSRPAFPNDLKLVTQCGPDPDRSHILFYATEAGAAGNEVLLLLTQKEYDALSDKTGVIPLSQSASLAEYVVVLFLEAGELSLKNCDTNDCNDKGSVMDFEIKPLLVHKKLLQGNDDGNSGKTSFEHVELRRYNVPVKTLASSADALNAFVALVDDGTLQRLAHDLEVCFNQYQSLLDGINTNPFGSLADFKNNLQYIIKYHPVLIQYYYDFIYDLIKAFYEFRYKVHVVTSECCGDEMKFPFHLMLGEAAVNTSGSGQSAWRQYFIYSPLFDGQSNGHAEVKSLLMRMVLMYQGFLFTEKSLRENRLALQQAVRVTPSRYGHSQLSERCIPYYYKAVQDKGDAIPGDLYYYWNYEKTKRGNQRYNLGYNAAAWSNADAIVNPLYYDIEWYNFFRVEGHIGKNINAALSNVKYIQQHFNLPFDTIALSADYIGALVKGEDPKCRIQDLESDYRVLIAEFVCRLHNAFCYVGKLDYTPPRGVETSDLFAGTAVVSGKKASAKKAAAATETAAATLLSARASVVAIDHPFIAGLVSEFQATRVYTKGTTLSRLCAPAANTIGAVYLDIIARNNGVFVNPVPAAANTTAFILYRHLFELTDSIESMFQLLMTYGLAEINTATFKSAYGRYESELHFINGTLPGLLKNIGATGKADSFAIDYLLDVFVDNVQILLHTCMVERLEALRSEYLRRVAQYRLAKNFGYYFKKHGGIEHKAGVPRGGTFILVYHENRRGRQVDVNSFFVNREMGSLLLSNFKSLLQPDADPDTLEYQAKLLAVATLYRDPELYLKFKDLMQQYLDECKDLPDDTRRRISVIISQPPQRTGFELADGMVIADFYVPYICCSDCPPIAYILTEEPSVSIAKNEFCSDDKTAYPVQGNPDGGVLKVDGKDLANSEGFVPAKYGAGTHAITYTLNGKTATATVTVIKAFKAEISHESNRDPANQGILVLFTIKTNVPLRAGALYEADYGDGSKLSTTDINQVSRHIYAKANERGQPYAVTIVITDGPCKATASDKVDLFVPPIN